MGGQVREERARNTRKTGDEGEVSARWVRGQCEMTARSACKQHEENTR